MSSTTSKVQANTGRNRMWRLSTYITGLVFCMGFSYRILEATADLCLPQVELTVTEPLEVNQGLGVVVAASGPWLVARAVSSPNQGQSQGVVHLYQCENDECNLAHTFIDPTPSTNRLYGVAVAIEQDWILIASVRTDSIGSPNASGDVSVFHRLNGIWQWSQYLVAPDIFPQDLYGTSVALQGDFAVVGAPGLSSGGPGASTARIFRRSGDTWSYEARVFPTNPPPTVYTGFGGRASISSGRVFVTAISEPMGPNRGGAVYEFKESPAGWQQASRIPNPSMMQFSYFGRSVCADDDTLVVGSDPDPSGPLGGGAAYVYSRDAGGLWTQAASLFPSTVPENSSGFGRSVALEGEWIVVGMPSFGFDISTFQSPGAAFLFRRGAIGWNQVAIIQPESNSDSAVMGVSVAVSSGRASVGAPRDEPPDRSGSITIIDLEPPLFGDANSDGVVGMKDITSILTNFGTAYTPVSGPGDSDQNGVVNFADVTATLARWGASCPS